MKEIVEEAKLVISKGEPVCPCHILRVKRLDWVDVEFMVRMLLTSGEVVPIPTLSVTVVSLTIVPSSCQPELPPPQEAQERVPDPSVCRQLLATCEEGHVYVWVLNVVAPVTARVEEPVIGPEALREPETKSEDPTVEEAVAKIPP